MTSTKWLVLLQLVTLPAFSWAATAPAAADLKMSHKGKTWTYKIVNKGSLPINSFFLLVEAPFKVVNTPKGWKVSDSDGCSHVSWMSTGEAGKKINPEDIAPGQTLGEFTISSDSKSVTKAEFILGTWDVEKGDAAKGLRNYVEVPGQPDGNCAHD